MFATKKATISSFVKRAYLWPSLLYTLLVVALSLWVILDIAGNLKHINKPFSPSLIQIDLLQSVAFPIAWSTLLIAITARIVGSAEEVKSEVSQLKTLIDSSDQARERQLAETKEQNAELVKRIETAMKDLGDNQEIVISQNRVLKEENDRFRQILSHNSIDTDIEE
ncbi:MAG: hypothetical protein OXE17_09920 [Chloroflexi bacterium]|nr:hypothetical protein [Chloroflexota bacterium]